jgi:hypothetical protein
MSARKITALAVLSLVAACRSAGPGAPETSPTPATVQAPPAAAPAAAPAPAGAVDPTGRWTLSLIAQGQAIEVKLDVVKTPDGGYGGTMSSDVFPTIPITKAKLEGKRLSLEFPVPSGDQGTMYLDIDGKNAEGEWAMPGMGSRVTGVKQ